MKAFAETFNECVFLENLYIYIYNFNFLDFNFSFNFLDFPENFKIMFPFAPKKEKSWLLASC